MGSEANNNRKISQKRDGERPEMKNVNTTDCGLAEKSKFRHCCSICCCMLCAVFGTIFLLFGLFCLNYSLYEYIMQDRLNMRPGLPPFEFWKNPEPEVTFKLIIWNVTNADAFVQGYDDKIKLEEVGPIVYEEVLQHTDVVFHANSTLSYNATKKIYFLEDRNVPGIMNETIVVPNLATLGLATFLDEAGYFTNMGAKLMMGGAGEGPFRTMSVYDFFWNYRSDVLTWSKSIGGSALVPTENMGMLIYEDYRDRLNVKIGPLNGPDKFFFLNTYNYGTTVPGFDVSKGDCNASIVDSTEGAIYPQNLQKDSVLNYWRRSLCRPVKLYFEEEYQKGPLACYKFVFPVSGFDRENDTEDCYKGKRELPSGVSDLSRCYHDFPFAASQPHFYGREGQLTEKFEGLSPQKELHESFLIVEPKMGVPAEQVARTQINLAVSDRLPGVYSEDIKMFNGMILPLFWLEYYQKELTPKILFFVDLAVNKLPAMEVYFGPIFLMLGLIMVAYVGCVCYRWREQKKGKLVVNGKA